MEAVQQAVSSAAASASQAVYSLTSVKCETWGQIGVYLLAALGGIAMFTLLFPWALTFLTYRAHSLKRRYGAEWALVTGGSSGIGLSLCKQLAAQGLNLIVAAYPDELLKKNGEALRQEFPHLQIRIVPVDLGASDHTVYMKPLLEATQDITVQLIFNNAGYMVTNFFEDVPLPRVLANYNCNATSAIVITHHFLTKLREGGLKGAICFTSSPANIMQSPFSVMYGATKAAITHFASSLAAEVAPEGVDICVVHPSPVATAFYNGALPLPTLQGFKSTATGPDRVADVILRGVGRSVIIDQGYYPITFRILLKLIDFTFLAELLPKIATTVGDYKFLKERQRQQRQQKLMEQQRALAEQAAQEAAAAQQAAAAATSKKAPAAVAAAETESESESESSSSEEEQKKKPVSRGRGSKAAAAPATPASASKKRAPSSGAKRR